jgi:hypothetical protein
MSNYRFTQADHTPALDQLANEAGATREYIDELERAIDESLGNPDLYEERCNWRKELRGAIEALHSLQSAITRVEADYFIERYAQYGLEVWNG